MSTDERQELARKNLWKYECRKCRCINTSYRSDLEICTAVFHDSKAGTELPPCGGKLGYAYAYHWQLVMAGLLEE